MADGASGRRDRLLRVVDEDELVDDLVAVRPVVVLELDGGVRIEVQIRQPALGGREPHQHAEQQHALEPVMAAEL